jgi:hypothetical protein
MDDVKTYHCASFIENPGGIYNTLCGISTGYQSWDYPLGFMENEVGPAYLLEKCKECANHPNLPMALLGDV